jgi:hypothetical protein
LSCIDFVFTMPTPSPFPTIDIPNVDIWDFLFERTDRPYPDDKGSFACAPHWLLADSSTA